MRESPQGPGQGRLFLADPRRVGVSDIDFVLSQPRAAAVGALAALVFPEATIERLVEVSGVSRRNILAGRRVAKAVRSDPAGGGGWVLVRRKWIAAEELTVSAKLVLVLLRRWVLEPTGRWMPGERTAAGLFRRCRGEKIMTARHWRRSLVLLREVGAVTGDGLGREWCNHVRRGGGSGATMSGSGATMSGELVQPCPAKQLKEQLQVKENPLVNRGADSGGTREAREFIAARPGVGLTDLFEEYVQEWCNHVRRGGGSGATMSGSGATMSGELVQPCPAKQLKEQLQVKENPLVNRGADSGGTREAREFIAARPGVGLTDLFEEYVQVRRRAGQE